MKLRDISEVSHIPLQAMILVIEKQGFIEEPEIYEFSQCEATLLVMAMKSLLAEMRLQESIPCNCSN